MRKIRRIAVGAIVVLCDSGLGLWYFVWHRMDVRSVGPGAGWEFCVPRTKTGSVIVPPLVVENHGRKAVHVESVVADGTAAHVGRFYAIPLEDGHATETIPGVGEDSLPKRHTENRTILPGQQVIVVVELREKVPHEAKPKVRSFTVGMTNGGDTQQFQGGNMVKLDGCSRDPSNQ